jgi:hypothetical protein
MTLRDDLLPVFEDVRGLVQDLGLRQTRVWKRLGEWSGGEIHLGDLTNTDTEITPRPFVRAVGQNLQVTKITPEFDDGGWSTEDLSPATANATDFYYVVQFPDGSLEPYRLVDLDASKNFTLALTLEPLNLNRPDEY